MSRRGIFLHTIALLIGGSQLHAQEIAYDGAGHILVVGTTWDTTKQVVGQVLSTSGMALSPSRVYTSGTRKYGPRVRFGGGRFLVVYTNEYSSSDHDIEGMFVRTDGTVESEFHIDFSSQEDWSAGGITYVAELNQFHVTYRRLTTSSNVPYDLRGIYVTASGAKQGASTLAAGLPTDYNMSSNSVASGPGNIVVMFRDGQAVQRGHIMPGQTSFQSRVTVANGFADFLSDALVTYHPGLNRFATTWKMIDEIYVQTLPANCTSSSCSGLSPVQVALSPALAGSLEIRSHAIAPAGQNFVLAGGARWSNRTGVSTVSIGSDAWPHTRHTSQWDTMCSNPLIPDAVEDAASLGSTALYVFRPFCPGPKIQALELSTWSGRVGTPFAITGAGD
jgi:hypothetical protein